MNERHDTGALVIWLIVVLALAFLLWQVCVRPGEAASDLSGTTPPASVRVTVRLDGVSCAGPLCCTAADAWIGNYHYTTGVTGYCEWFKRPMVAGQLHTVTMFRMR